MWGLVPTPLLWWGIVPFMVGSCPFYGGVMPLLWWGIVPFMVGYCPFLWWGHIPLM